MAANLRRWRIAVGTHDVENPGHDPAYGIALNPFDIERLGLAVGESLWSGVSLYEDSGGTSNFRILCDGEHAEKIPSERDECDLRKKEGEPLKVVTPNREVVSA